MRVGKDDALALAQLERDVVGEQAGAVRGLVGGHVLELERGLFGDADGAPDLAVRVGVGAAHGGAFVFKDLQVGVLLARRGDGGGKGVVWVGGGQVRGIDGGPGVDYGDDVGGGEVGEGEVVGRVEGYHVAFALCSGCAQEEGGLVCGGGEG